MQIDATVRLAGDRGSDDVHETEHCGARRLRGPQRLERIRRLAGLRDRDGDRPGEPQLAAIAILRRVLDRYGRSEEHTSELQSQSNLVCRLLLEKKKKQTTNIVCLR